ncbi:MAG: HAMP domain-containing histidine kinase [Microcoleus sp. SIO2G3]|nr:HAMP domain-containing histidine kinase [Microcoleus sp. SIO2G3]
MQNCKALQKERELNELKSRFISISSHEFRTPLTTIFSSAELLERYCNKYSKEKQLTYLHRIKIAVGQMTQLLDDVLLVGKAEAGKLEFKPEPVD